MHCFVFGNHPLGEAQGEQATSRVYGGAAIYSRDAAGAAAAKGKGQQDGGGNYAPIGGHEAHNARTGADTDYNGGGNSNRGNTPPSGGDGGGNGGGGGSPDGGGSPGGSPSRISIPLKQKQTQALIDVNECENFHTR
ncbi:hypothetical protein [Marinobacterium sp. BA1]|uniref:hypothetical protein n=1 Tax=Marinobacterium sp. BA1 TaxID=3138931 RepID=UPI0032E7E6F8